MRARVLIIALACVIVAAAGIWLATREQKPPNVLLISVDTLRRDHTGFSGYGRPITPSLDALASESVVFTNAYSVSGWTFPCMATILTGAYPKVHGATDFHYMIDSKVPTLASVLRRNGYDTRAFVSHVGLIPRYGFGTGFVKFDASVLQVGHPHEVATADQISNLAIADLEQVKEPFFMWVHYFDPHFKYLPHEDWASLGDTDLDRYDQEIAFTDREIGRLLAALEERGLSKRTVVIFTSDHGEEFGDHGGKYHETLYEEIVQVPLTIRVPGRTPGESAVPAEQVDFVPTILALAGIERPEGLPGKDLLATSGGGGAGAPGAPATAAGSASSAGAICMERDRPPGFRQRGIIDGDLKVIAVAPSDTNLIPWASRGVYWQANNVHVGTWMFDLSADPRETRNLFAGGLAGAHGPRLLAAIAEYTKDEQQRTAEVPMDERLREQLRALGYLR